MQIADILPLTPLQQGLLFRAGTAVVSSDAKLVIADVASAQEKRDVAFEQTG